MYSWIWNRLPGGKLLKGFLSVLLVLAAVALCFLGLFPWLDSVFVDSPLIDQ